MKLVSIDVVAFGKLKDFSLSFSDGINRIQGDNGYGKSTLSAFIRAMLYGLNYTRTKVDGEMKNDVSRYMPWGSTQRFGGSMVVEHQGENYRIERFFGSTEKQQTLKVVALSVGKELPITNIGEHFLRLTVESYDRSIYYPQEYVEIKSNDNFDAKLSNFVEDTTVDYETLTKKLRDYKRKLRLEKGNGGVIYDLETQQSQLQRQLFDVYSQEKANVLRQQQVQEITAQLQQNEQKTLALQKEIDSLQQQLYQCQPTEVEKEQAKRKNEVQLQLAQIPKTIQQDKEQFDNLLAQHKQLQGAKRGLSSHTKFAIVFSVILVAVVATLLILNQLVIAGAFGVIAVAISAILSPKFKRDTLLENLQQLQDEMFAIATRYLDTNGKSLDQVASEFWNYHSEYNKLLAIYQALGDLPQNNAQEQRDALTKQIDGKKALSDSLLQQTKSLEKQLHQLQFELSRPIASAVELQEQIEKIAQQIAQAKRKHQVATLVGDLLVQSKENLSSAYIPELCDKSSQLLNAITNGKYQLITNRNFAISLTENGKTNSIASYSRGIKEITLLCFRVALSQILMGNNIPFLIMDDAFVNFDEQNFNRATSLLKQLSAQTQVIYFTCHDRTGNF